MESEGRQRTTKGPCQARLPGCKRNEKFPVCSVCGRWIVRSTCQLTGASMTMTVGRFVRQFMGDVNAPPMSEVLTKMQTPEGFVYEEAVFRTTP